jgi:hypothetical protein
MAQPRDIRRASTRMLSALMIVLGVVGLVSTLARGGGPLAIGVIFGILFIGAGTARLYLERDER